MRWAVTFVHAAKGGGKAYQGGIVVRASNPHLFRMPKMSPFESADHLQRARFLIEQAISFGYGAC